MNRLQLLWWSLRSSLWFIPALVLLLSVVGAIGLTEFDVRLGFELQDRWPRLFGASADASRNILSAIATSMITVAGVVFSTTIVALSLAASQYSPRVLSSFSNDRFIQLVLGVFVGVFVYCLLVLRTVRGEDTGDFVPSIAIMGGIVYAVAAVVLLIFYIHHVANSIQASAIVEHIADDTQVALERLFPASVGQPAPRAEPPAAPLPLVWTVAYAANRDGYLRHVDADRLLQCAADCGRAMLLTKAMGEFVVQGTPMVMAAGADTVDEALCHRLESSITLGRQRTVEQDPAYGLQQLVDVAVKALSPGINDPTTATLCVDRVGALIRRVADRPMPAPRRFSDGALRVVVPVLDFATLVQTGLSPIVQHSRGDLLVLSAVLQAVRTVADAAAHHGDRQRALAHMARQVTRELQLVQPHRRGALVRRRARLLERMLARRARSYQN